jgi:hypothetical protein
MLSNLFRNGAPWLVGTARGIIEAAALAGLVAAAGAVSATDAPPELQALAPALLAIIRILEGLLDQLDPSKARRSL